MYKLFIGGISPETTQADLKKHFDRFGQISSFIIVQDKATSVSKGYGFINCENKKTYDRILGIKTHMVRDRMVEVNHAIKRNGEVPEDIKLKSLRKLFVGGLGFETTRDDLVAHFSQFGDVANAYIIYDPLTKQSKNFGYVELQRPEDATYAASHSEHIIKGKKASVQFFKAKDLQKRLPTVQDKVERTGVQFDQQGPYKSSLFLSQKGKLLNQGDCARYQNSLYFSNQYPKEMTMPDSYSSLEKYIVQPVKSENHSPMRQYSDFYVSLQRAQEQRDVAETYSKRNLRFSRPRAYNY